MLTLLCAVVTGAWGALTFESNTETGTITFGSGANATAINAAEVTGEDDLGNTWTITTEGTTSFTANSAYYQVGSSSKPATSITFTTTLPKSQTIKSFVAKFGGFNGTAGDISLQVGDTKVGSGSLNATSDVTVSSTQEAEGTVLTVTVTNIAKGVKCYSISYTYEKSGDNPPVSEHEAWFENSKIELEVGESTELFLWKDPSDLEISWTVLNDDNAIEFNENTLEVVALAEGSAYVIASWDSSNSTECYITVKAATPKAKFYKVDNTNQLVAGNEFIMVAEAKNKAMAGYGSSTNYRDAKDIEISDKTIEVKEDEVAVLTLGGSKDAYTFLASDNNKYLALTSDANQLHSATEATETTALWTISSDFRVSNNKYTERYIECNNTDFRFATYKSSQSKAYLYVKEGYQTGKSDPEVYFDKDFINITLDDLWEGKAINLLHKPDNLQVSVEISNPIVSYDIETGKIGYIESTLGQGTITVSWDGDDNYNEGQVSFSFDVFTPDREIYTIAEFKTLAIGSYTRKWNLLNAHVLYIDDNYMVCADNTGGILIEKPSFMWQDDYPDVQVKQFDIIYDYGFKGTYGLDNGAPVATDFYGGLNPPSKNEPIEPTAFSSSAATQDNICRYIYKMSEVTLSGSGKSFTATLSDGSTFKVYNKFDIDLTAPTAGKKYDVTGVLGYYQKDNIGDGVYQLWPIADFEGEKEKLDAELTFEPNSVTMFLGETANTTFSNPNELQVVFTNEDETVATYSNGIVTALQVGTTTITATSEETDDFKAGEAVLTINVLDPTAIAEFHETFDDVKGIGGNDGIWNGSTISSTPLDATTCDMQGWTFEYAYPANKCIKLGKGSNGKGSATTPPLGIKGEATFSFKAGAWDHPDEELVLDIEVNNGGFIDDGKKVQTASYAVTMKAGEWTTYELKLKDLTLESTITFIARYANKNRFFLDGFDIVEERMNVNVDISSVGYATLYYSDKNLVVPEGVEAMAYKLNNAGDNIEILQTFKKGDVIPMGCGVVLEAETKGELQTFTFMVSNDQVDAVTGNLLLGLDEDGTTVGPDENIEYKFYMLSTDKNGENVGFYWKNGGAPFTTKAHKAYLAIPKSSNVNASSFVFDDLTGIRSIAVDNVENTDGVYTLSGIRMDGKALPKGIYIVNGKKMVIK